MSTPLLLLLSGCLPGEYFSYPATNDQWHPEGIGEALSDKGADLHVESENLRVWNLSGQSDSVLQTQGQQADPGLSQRNLWQAYGVRLLSVTMNEREIRIPRHCEEDHSPYDDDVLSDPPHESSEPADCESNVEYEYKTLGSMRFDYELEDRECLVSITRPAPLDYSDASVWRFREYPEDPEWSDVNTCEDLMSDEDAVGALDEIVFEFNPLTQEIL